MLELLAIPLVLQVVLPVALLLWLALGSHSSRAAWLLVATLTASYLAAVAAGGLWLALPTFLPAVYALLFVAALVLMRPRARGRPAWPRSTREKTGVVLRAAGAVVAAVLLAHVQSGRRPPGDAVPLAFPLRGGTYLVANGGSVALVNAHLATLDGARFRAYRGQSYGVDLVRVDGRGLRARGFLPRDPAAYAIFGDSVIAPCAGQVVTAVDGYPDMPVPQADRRQLAGNHVILACGEAWVVLGHFQRGSVCVHAGDRVAAGHPLGRVGNSGNTNEPHLHVHAQRPGTRAAPLGGEPLPVRFDGRYLVRNARVAHAG